MGLGWKDCWHCFILLIQVDQAHDLIVLEEACTRGDVIPVQVALKACTGGLRTLDCLSKLMTVLPLHSKSKILEVQRIVEWILADDKPCQASRCLLSPYLAKAGISAISDPVLFLQCLVSYIIGLDVYFIHQNTTWVFWTINKKLALVIPTDGFLPSKIIKAKGSQKYKTIFS